jgi:hypothetical protein
VLPSRLSFTKVIYDGHAASRQPFVKDERVVHLETVLFACVFEQSRASLHLRCQNNRSPISWWAATAYNRLRRRVQDASTAVKMDGSVLLRP